MTKTKTDFIDWVTQNRLLSHSLFWAVILFSAPITSDESITEVGEAFLFRAVAMPAKMVATYLLAYYQIPQLLQKRKYIRFVVSLLWTSIVIAFAYRLANVHIAESLSGSENPKESLLEMTRQFDFTYFGYAPRAYFYAFLFLFIKMVKDRTLERRQLETLHKEKALAELNFLKAQIHPHFLFNTLNNLYALTLAKSDEAPEVVAKLSEILDYILYQGKESKVLVLREVELLEHYIALEKLRYGDRLQLGFDYTLDDNSMTIAPMILISLVENAFKHGVSDAIDEVRVEIGLHVKEGKIHFSVFNTKSPDQHREPASYREGIGVKNVQRQLELVYPGRYNWEVKEEEGSYEVNLTIEG